MLRAVVVSGYGMTMKRWTFEMLEGAEGFAKLRVEWQALTDRLPELHFVQCPQWAGAYLASLEDEPAMLRWLTVRESGQLAAVLPLKATRRGWGPLASHELHALTHPHMTLVDVAAGGLDDDLGRAFLEWLAEDAGRSCDRVLFPLVAENSVLGRWIGMARAELHQSAAIDGCAWLDCDRTYEALLKSASANHRSSLSRGAKRAAEQGPLRYETAHDPLTLDAAMTHFMAIEVSGWKGEQGGAVACDPHLIKFYRQLLQEMGERGRCEIDLLWLKERPIATILWFRTGGQLHLQKIAYVEDLSALGPGKLIMAEALKRACADLTLQRISFITRCPWADGWRTSITPIWRHQIYPRTWRGRLVAAVDRSVRDAKDRLKPWVQRWRSGGTVEATA